MSRYTRETESLRAKQEFTEEKLKYEFLEQVWSLKYPLPCFFFFYCYYAFKILLSST